MRDPYRALFTSPIRIREVAVSAYFPVVDKFGKESQGLVYETRMYDKVGYKINWANSDVLDFSHLRDVIFLLPDLRP